MALERGLSYASPRPPSLRPPRLRVFSILLAMVGLSAASSTPRSARTLRSRAGSERHPPPAEGLVPPPVNPGGGGPPPGTPPPGPDPAPRPLAAGIRPPRCAPCVTRGRRSLCDRGRPACSKCVTHGTEADCVPWVDRAPSPPGRPATPQPAPRRLPSVVPSIRTPSPPPARPVPPPSAARSRRSSVSSRANSPARPHARAPVPDRRRSPPPLVAHLRHPVGFDAANERQRVAARLEALEVQAAQERFRLEQLDALQQHAPPGPPFVPPGPAAAPPGLPAAPPGPPIAPPGLPAAPPGPPPGLNVGHILPASAPRGPIAIGVVADARYSFVSQNVIDLFRRSNGSTYVPLWYCTDAYNRQSHAHGPISRYRSHVDPTTGLNVVEAAPLPDGGEASMSFLDHTRAFQRFIAVLEAIGDPLVGRWRLHGHIVQHHADITENWPLVLSYCIAVRRRAVHDHSLDMGTFQSRIYEDCRTTQQSRQFRELMRAASAVIPPPRAPASAPRAPAVAPSATQSGPAGSSTPASYGTAGSSCRCFACGGYHNARGCKNAPVLVTVDSAGRWLLDGKQFCYRFNNPNGCDSAACTRAHTCALCGTAGHSAQTCRV
ncbi:hypothetical protein FS749_004434 [Ceratobasidium sp. UAMH 11750]|nr:hypothetical protein FS749_004434 [Ceratobasidium sp. UAMH 11750]